MPTVALEAGGNGGAQRDWGLVVMGEQAPLLSGADINNVHQSSTWRINELIRSTQSTSEG